MVSSGGRPLAPPTCAYFEFHTCIDRLALKRTFVAERFPPGSKGRRTILARYRCLLQFHTLEHVLIHWIPRGTSWRNCLRLGLKERPRCGIFRCRHHHVVSGPWRLGSRQSFRTFAKECTRHYQYYSMVVIGSCDESYIHTSCGGHISPSYSGMLKTISRKRCQVLTARRLFLQL